MSNSHLAARFWTHFVAARPEFLRGELLLRQFAAGEITRLCDCGCNSYDIDVPKDKDLIPLLADRGSGGLVFQMEFNTSEPGKTVSLTVFVGKEGYFSGLDVDYCGNSLPMPENVSMAEPPFHIYGVLSQQVQPSDRRR